MSDTIEIRGLRAFGRHGVLAAEQRDGQTFLIDLRLQLDLSAAAGSDALADTVDYAALAAAVVGRVADTRYDLIEALAEDLAGLALSDPRVEAVDVRVAKPDAPLPVEAIEVAVRLRRSRR